jgi:sensor histidine kinase YesM
MKIKAFLSILFILQSGTNLFCKNQVDSLCHVLNESKSYTQHIDLLFKIANQCVIYKPDTAEYFARTALDYAKQSRNYYDIAYSHFLMGNVYRKSSLYYKALQEYYISQALAEKYNHKKLFSAILKNIAVIEIKQEDYFKAQSDITRGIDIANKISDSEELAGLYNAQGQLYEGKTTKNENYYLLALRNYVQSLDLYKKLGKEEEICILYTAVGIIYSKQNKDDSTIAYFDKAIRVAEKIGYNDQKAYILNNLACLYLFKDQYSRALPYQLQSIELAKKNRNYYLLGFGYGNLGGIYSGLKDYKSAYDNDVISTYYDDSIRRKDLSIAYAEAETKHKTEEQIKTNNVLKLQNYASYSGGMLILVFSLILFNRNRVISKAKQKVEATVNELTIAREKLLESEKELEYKVVLRTAELAGANEQLHYEIVERNKAEAEIIDFNRKVAELQMTALRLQMNPHFIFNSLNSIQHFIYNNNKAEAAAYLSKFSRLIREILEHDNDNTIIQAEEMKMLELYIQLEMLRFDHKFDYILDIDSKIDIENIEIPTMLIQPFVENAILHGLIPKKDGKGSIIISFKKEGQSIICIIEDNGIGREQAEAMKAGRIMNKTSLGIKVTKDRLSMLRHNTENEGYVEIIDLKDEKGNATGTRVEIRIPVEDD